VPPRSNPKKAEQAKLRERRSITLTIEADELTLQRLSALLLLAQQPFEVSEIVAQGDAMPFDEPTEGPPLEIDYEAVRRDIARLVGKLSETGMDTGTIIAAIRRYGAKISEVPREKLLPLNAELRALAGE
jgi:hypothetical protein